MISFVKRPYTKQEELWHILIHGSGVLLSVAMVSVLVTLSAVYGSVWSIVSTAIFGAGMILMYAASTAYHAAQKESTKRILKKFDHIAIYYLIAGTYTPFLLVNLRGYLGWTLFGIIWGLAVIGTILKLCVGGSGTKVWSIGLYLGMGWLVVVASKKLFETLPVSGLTFLILGGLFYTLGILFYIWKSRLYTHAIWHGFVLAGSIMHFFAILFSCVIP